MRELESQSLIRGTLHANRWNMIGKRIYGTFNLTLGNKEDFVVEILDFSQQTGRR